LDADNQIEGEFFASDDAELKVKYNTHTGQVYIVPTFTTHHVTLFYSPKSFEIFIVPLKNIIDLRNKRDFLLALSKLEILNISSIISKHIDDDGNFTRKFSLNDVNDTLMRIQQRVSKDIDRTKVQHAFYEILGGNEIINIKTKQEAENIIDRLKDCLNKDPVAVKRR
jgi:hypothetical protein